MTYFKKLYKFDSHRWCDDQLIYDEPNLIKALNNPEFKQLKNQAQYFFTVYYNVSHITGHYDPNIGRYSYSITAQLAKPINLAEMIDLYDRAQAWYEYETAKAKHYYYLVSQHNSHYGESNEPSDEEFDQQLAKLFGSNYSPYPFEHEARYGFGTTIDTIDDWKSKRNYHYTYSHYPKSHNSQSNGGHGRVNHSKSANARTNYNAKANIKALQHNSEFINTKIRHINRRYTKNHPEEFPVFDDAEYIEGPYSTGWKHSSKARKSWGQHYNGQYDKHCNKRALAKQLNDWSKLDQDEAKYYSASQFWLTQPNPNLVSMHDYPIELQRDQAHISLKLQRQFQEQYINNYGLFKIHIKSKS